ncbi:MAG: lipopolysaccharide biosynthesis protein [Cyanobacteria bacterium RU_5_0]|nr:lipopolysaccharide biosynthesis protein [Cyanobacteria bacterium RU_5_0]
MSIKQKAIKGVLWTAIQNWGSQLGSLIVFFVLARLLDPETFGLVALANVFLAFMQVFLDQGFAQALIQRKELESAHLDTAFWINLGIGTLLTVTGFVAASWVANLFHQAQLTSILQCLSILFFIRSFSGVQQAILERKFAFKAVAVRLLLGTAISGVVSITMALNGFGIWSLVFQQLVHELIGALALWFASDWRPRFKFSVPHFKHLFGFGSSILGFNFLGFINNRADDFLIGYFLGPTALGYYAIAYRILTVMTDLLVNTSSQVTLPTFSRLQEEPERFRKAFYSATQLTSSIAFPIFLGVVVFAPELVLLLFGIQWLPSIPVMQVLALVGILRSVTYFKGSVFIAMGKPTWRLWLGLLSAGLNLVGFIVAVRWGIIAVSFAYLIRSLIVFPIGQWAVSKLIHTPLLDYLSQFIAPLISSLVMAIALLGIKQLLGNLLGMWALLAISVVFGAIIYGIAIRLISPSLFQKLQEFIYLALSRAKRQNA